MGDFSSQDLANFAWAVATATQCDAALFAPLFVALAVAAERRVCDFKLQGLANLAWAFATAPVCAALARMAERGVGDVIVSSWLASTA